MDFDQFDKNGYTIAEYVFSAQEIASLTQHITEAVSSGSAFRKSDDLFAIRQFLKAMPQIHTAVFTAKLKALLVDHFGTDYFVVKSIYFDKPEASNWFVAWHQDLTISVDKKVDLPGFASWTTKQGQFAVRPPLCFLENIVTVRIHLDDTDENNGALRVVPGSHRAGVYRYAADQADKMEMTCRVRKGRVDVHAASSPTCLQSKHQWQ